jgi:hypothetical protein
MQMIFQNKDKNVSIQEKINPIFNNTNTNTDLNLLKNQQQRSNKYDMFKISLNYSGKCASCGRH